MKYAYFDAKSGLSGDMILGALLDLGVPVARFKHRMAALKLPVRILVREVKRSHFRGLRVNVSVAPPADKTRKFNDVEKFIKKSAFSPEAKDRARAIFKNLFEAEARVHGSRFEGAHLHEAGADDALIDVLGTCWLAEELGIGEFFSSPLNVGEGWVKSSHGILPVPPPAVAELLKGVPVYSAHARQELVTPTGAAIVKTLVKKFIPFPEITYEKIGYGAGSRDIAGLANILRVFYGEARGFFSDKRVYIVEATIDDSNPQVLASFMDRAFELGALDVYLAPIVMKKNRLGTKLTVLAELDRIDGLIAAVFRETSSIGVRYFPVERRALDRTRATVRVLGKPVGIKISTLGGERINVQPEFSDCLTVAREKQVPVKDVLRLALQEYAKKG
jgi:uncharacterized protein (TIGR00299 family) protein